MASFRKVSGLISSIIITFSLLTGCSKDVEIVEDLSVGMLAEVNKVRSEGCQCGSDFIPPVPAMKWNSSLEYAADRHVKDMYYNNYFSHISPDGKSPAQRAMEAGYYGQLVGENIARGYDLIKNVVNGWKSSESHCKAMMDSLYSEMGAARYKDYWVMDMGQPY